MEKPPIPENLNVAKTTENLVDFKDRLDGLDKAFNEKSKLALQSLNAFEKEFNKYLKDKGIKSLRDEKIEEKYADIAKKIIDISQKINALRDSEDFSVENDEKIKLPESATKAGFTVLDNHSLHCSIGVIMFTAEEGTMKDLAWENGELLVTTSKNLKFGIKLDRNEPIREIK